MKVGYIVHDLNDPSVERRRIMLEKGGAEVLLAGFYRGKIPKDNIAKRQPFILGQTYDAAMIKRAVHTLKHSLLNKNLEIFFSDCDVIMARNLEQLTIATKLSKFRPLIYECLDLHRLLLLKSPPAKLIQALENRLLPHVNLLITSSPAFMRHHFDKTPLRAPWHLVENKFTVPQTPPSLQTSAQISSPLRIGWFGMLRCKKTFAILRKIAALSAGKIEVIISGKPSTAELPNLPEEAAIAPGVTYTGPYTYEDLPDLYHKCHFAWAIDWFEEGLNSDWLLPNRLYESIAHGAVPIVLEQTEMGRWLKKRDIGLIASRNKPLEDTILSLDMESIKYHQNKLSSVEITDVFADKTDSLKLVKLISSIVKK